MTKLLVISALALPAVAFGADGWPFIDQIMKFIEDIPAMAYPIILGVIEFVLRLIPSPKPLGILQVIGAVLKQVGALFLAIGNFLDKVLPQRLK